MQTCGLLLGFLQNISPMDWLLILAVALILFGRRLPEVARSLGKSVVEFKRGLNEVKDDVTTAGTDKPREPDKTP